MGTWTELTPTCLCYKLNDICGGSCAPLLWYALFSPDDMFVEKSDDGENYACAETTIKKARNRVRKIRQRIQGNAYANILLAPLQFIEQALSDIGGDNTVGFNLADFQSGESGWGPTSAMEYVETLVFYSKFFDDFIKGAPLAKLLKHISFDNKGTLENDKQYLLKEIGRIKKGGGWVTELYTYAFEYLMGGPVDGDKSIEAKKYDSWVEQNKHIWGEVSEKKSLAEATVETQREPKKHGGVETVPQNGLVKKHKYGKLVSELNYKDGKLHGLCKYYNDSGILERELNYKNGKRNGLCKYWEDGYIRSISNYRNDRLNGIDKYFEYETKELLEENIFKNGKVIKKLR